MAFVDFFVLICFLVGTLSAVLVAFHPNILYAAVALIFTLLSVAGLYGALGADFIAGVQLAIYVGAVVVVILFAVMMSAEIYKKSFWEGARKFLGPSVMAVLISVGLIKLIKLTTWERVEELNRVAITRHIGEALIGPYALVFEYVAIILLAGLIGAVVVARPEIGEKQK